VLKKKKRHWPSRPKSETMMKKKVENYGREGKKKKNGGSIKRDRCLKSDHLFLDLRRKGRNCGVAKEKEIWSRVPFR